MFKKTAEAAAAILTLSSGLMAPAVYGQAPAPVENEGTNVVSAAQALSGANIPSLDPHTMTRNEIEKVLGSGPLCTYHYTSSGNPILAFNQSPAAGAPAGVVKLDGELIALSAMAVDGGFGLAADQVRLIVLPEDLSEDGEREEAVLRFEVGDQLSVGYLGYFGCL